MVYKFNNKKVKAFIETFELWRQFFVMPPVKYAETELGDDSAGILDDAQILDSKNVSTVQYNTKIIKKRSLAEAVGDALHELGHYIQRLPYETHTEKVISENAAEKFALNMLKTYYPHHYKIKIKKMKVMLLDTKIWENDSVHREAYEKLEEYQDGLE